MKSMTEVEVMKVFNSYKQQLIKQLGTQVTDNIQLDRVAYKLLGTRFKGTYSVDTVPIKKSGMFIVNTDLSTNPGVHWVSVFSTAKNVYVFDSFGRKTKNLLKPLVKNAKIYQKKVIDSDYDVDQKISSFTCGPLSIAWLLCVKELGIKNALKI
jgi:hypothetical protein